MALKSTALLPIAERIDPADVQPLRPLLGQLFTAIKTNNDLLSPLHRGGFDGVHSFKYGSGSFKTPNPGGGDKDFHWRVEHTSGAGNDVLGSWGFGIIHFNPVRLDNQFTKAYVRDNHNGGVRLDDPSWPDYMLFGTLDLEVEHEVIADCSIFREAQAWLALTHSGVSGSVFHSNGANAIYWQIKVGLHHEACASPVQETTSTVFITNSAAAVSKFVTNAFPVLDSIGVSDEHKFKPLQVAIIVRNSTLPRAIQFFLNGELQYSSITPTADAWPTSDVLFPLLQMRFVSLAIKGAISWTPWATVIKEKELP